MSLNKAESKHMNKPRLFCMVDMSLCPQVLDRLREVADVEYYASPDRALLLERIDDVDVYYGHTDVRLDREVIDRAKRLKLVGAPSTGTDHIDIELLKQRGIKLISNTREYELLERFTSTAECGWALLLACTRRIPYHFAGVQNGRWMESRYTGRQLAEKTLGVVGVGRLGKMTVEFGKAFRMRVLGCDPVDFSIMKEGVVIINTSRGGLIDEQAFLAALQSGKVAAAGADVLCDADWMDDVTKHPLVNFAQTHDNLILSPHIGGITVEAIAESRIFMTEKLVDYIKSNF
jgi:D-3-phosphoglycerate dehydrogenase